MLLLPMVMTAQLYVLLFTLAVVVSINRAVSEYKYQTSHETINNSSGGRGEEIGEE